VSSGHRCSLNTCFDSVRQSPVKEYGRRGIDIVSRITRMPAALGLGSADIANLLTGYSWKQQRRDIAQRSESSVCQGCPARRCHDRIQLGFIAFLVSPPCLVVITAGMGSTTDMSRPGSRFASCVPRQPPRSCATRRAMPLTGNFADSGSGG
jgi:hypothetical protein